MAAGDVIITRDFVLGRGEQGCPRFVFGTVVLDGGNPTPIALANLLSAIDGCGATIEGSVATGADPNQISVVINGTTLDIYAWKVTTGGAAGNPTEIASTDNARLVQWWAQGPKK